ncbi:MAG: hypothetical protein Q9206_004710 [Seirophora lacunosa]
MRRAHPRDSIEPQEQLSAIGWRDALAVNAQNAAQRYDLWAANLGLFTAGHSSLKYRLGDAPLIYNYARRTLADLEKYLAIALHDTRKEGDPLPGISKHGKVPTTLDPDQAAILDESEDEDFGCYDDEVVTSVALGNVFIQLREGRTAVSASAYDDEINADNQKNQTQAEAKDDKDDEEKEEETDEGDLSDGEDQRCQMKQNVAYTRRRQQFKHWKNRRDKVEAYSQQAGDFTPWVNMKTNMTASNTGHKDFLDVQPIPNKSAPSIPSTVTRIDQAQIDMHDAMSIVSTSTYARLSKESDFSLEIPPLPGMLGHEKDFECRYCHIMCPGRMGRANSWV